MKPPTGMRSVQTSLYANGMATSRMTRMMGTSATNLRKNLTMGPMPNTADVEVVNADKTPSELQVRCGMTLCGVLFLTMGPRILCRDMVTFFHQNMASQEKNLKRTILIKHSCPSVSLLSRRTIFKEWLACKLWRIYVLTQNLNLYDLFLPRFMLLPKRPRQNPTGEVDQGWHLLLASIDSRRIIPGAMRITSTEFDLVTWSLNTRALPFVKAKRARRPWDELIKCK